jgi:hypothetical protein
MKNGIVNNDNDEDMEINSVTSLQNQPIEVIIPILELPKEKSIKKTKGNITK